MRGNTVRTSWLRLRDGNSGAHRAIKDEEEKRIVWIGGCSRMARGGTTVKPCVVPSSNSRRDIAGNSQSRIVTLPCHSSGNRGCFANDIERPVSLNTLAAKRMGGARTKMTTQSGQHCLVLVCVLVLIQLINTYEFVILTVLNTFVLKCLMKCILILFKRLTK